MGLINREAAKELVTDDIILELERIVACCNIDVYKFCENHNMDIRTFIEYLDEGDTDFS